MSVHLGESVEEIEFIEKGSGPGARCSRSSAPGAMTGPFPRAIRSATSIATASSMRRRWSFTASNSAIGAVAPRGDRRDLVTCPRSNRWVGAGYPPIERFYKSGVAVAVGTDSLASVEDLNLFSRCPCRRRRASGAGGPAGAG